MKPKMIAKLAIDLAMTIILILLMAYQIVGDYLHEWFGAAMLALFIAHTVLNFRWYKSLFKGKYTAARVISTAINFAVLAAILLLGYSGVVLSRHLFAFLPIEGGLATARVLHLAASYWGFVLMGMHLGLHWGMILAAMKKAFSVTKKSKAAGIVMRILVISASVYGGYAFCTEKIADNLFLQTHFVFFDYEASAIEVFAKYIAMLVLFAAIAYYILLLLRKPWKKSEKA